MKVQILIFFNFKAIVKIQIFVQHFLRMKFFYYPPTKPDIEVSKEIKIQNFMRFLTLSLILTLSGEIDKQFSMISSCQSIKILRKKLQFQISFIQTFIIGRFLSSKRVTTDKQQH